MTHSHHTFASTKGKQSQQEGNRPAPEYMDINTDDAEAGSILMSLSQHPKKVMTSATKPIPSSNSPASSRIASTMSIRNLLGEDDKRPEPASRKQSILNDDAPVYPRARQEGTMHRHPEVIPEASSPPSGYSLERRQPYGMYHAQPSSLPPSTHMRSTGIAAHGPSESYDWQQRPAAYHQQQRPIKHLPPPHRHDPPPSYAQQSYHSMKKNPKIRRNALHAYISYMTYSDLMRTRVNLTSQQPPVIKQHIPTSITDHHQPPLTAFLKQYVEPPSFQQSVTTPTTPRPKQAFPPQQQMYYPHPPTQQHYYPSHPSSYSPVQKRH
ncbi:hypothetical protein [Absidia glauca]|uniref:Uncharacterized protein n=1 Tax=Absidia glauca TaxID=4829 RepID=A0A163L0R8_ABSGL|nr:hypothetical protein [Absidia glauca]